MNDRSQDPETGSGEGLAESGAEYGGSAQAVLEPPAKRKQPIGLGTHGRTRETDVPWHEIRAAVEGGMALLKASKHWGVSYERLKKHSQRAGWVIPMTVIARAREKAQAMGIDVPRLSLQPSEPRNLTPEGREKVGTALLMNVTELAESGSLTGARLVHGLLERAALSPDKLMPLVDVKDLGSAVKTLRLAGGLDKNQSQISFNLWGSQQHVPMRDIGDNLGDKEGDNGNLEWDEL